MRTKKSSVIERVLLAIRRRPTARDVLELGVALLVLGLIALPVALTTGLAHWPPRTIDELIPLAFRALFIPALGEELVFRGVLVPTRGASGRPAVWIAFSTTLFVLWHVVETTFLPGSASTFLRADFLGLAALLGVLCAVLRYRSGSIWTAILLHWIFVVAWQGWFGGPLLGRAE